MSEPWERGRHHSWPVTGCQYVYRPKSGGCQGWYGKTLLVHRSDPNIDQHHVLAALPGMPLERAVLVLASDLYDPPTT